MYTVNSDCISSLQLSLCLPQHVFLPISCLFLNNTLSEVIASCVLGVWSSTEAVETYKWPQLQKRMFLPPPAVTHLSVGMGPGEDLPTNAEILSGLILDRSCAGDHCCES